MRAFLLAGLCLSLALATSVSFSGDKVDSPVKLACPVAGKAIDKSMSSDYGGGKVYFCCAKCKAKFDADNAKFATKANLQLAASGQAKQTKCPFSGEDMKESTKVTVAGVDVQFCCDDCKAKVAAAKADKQIEMVFGSKPFSKAFKVAKEESRR
jgi:YHS domain-containing protein